MKMTLTKSSSVPQITESYAFLPREAVTKFLLGCVQCQRRSDGELSSSDKSKTASTPSLSPCDQTVPSRAPTGPTDVTADSETHRQSSDDSRQEPTDSDDIFNETPKSVMTNASAIRRRIHSNVHSFETKSEKGASAVKNARLLGTSPDSVEPTIRLSSSTPDSNRDRSLHSDSTISKSSDSSISPIEPDLFTKPYPKRLYTVHPTTLETIPIPLSHTDISIYYERNRPYMKPRRRADADWPPILSTYLQYMRSLGHSDEEALKLDSELVSNRPLFTTVPNWSLYSRFS